MRNAEFLPRFQTLCESFALRPTYLVSYEMANAPAFREFGMDILKRRTAEVGMHLHAWNTPPLVPLTKDDFVFQPYLAEYPRDIVEKKVAVITGLLEDTFGVKMISHRAGRWGLDEIYARVLAEKGYRVDCSVTPYVSWEHHAGNPEGRGGSDYSRFPSEAYFVDLDDISRPGESPLLEVPMTIVSARSLVPEFLRRSVGIFPLARRALDRFLPSFYWLRPNGRNREVLVRIVRNAVRDGRAYVEFMLHSSELMPGGSSNFPKNEDIQNLYRDLEALFWVASERCVAATLAEYYAMVSARPTARAVVGKQV